MKLHTSLFYFSTAASTNLEHLLDDFAKKAPHLFYKAPQQLPRPFCFENKTWSKIQKFVRRQDQAQRIFALLLLNYALSSQYKSWSQKNNVFAIPKHTELGVPYINERLDEKGDPLYLSLSHTENTVAVALSKTPVGCDVQKYISYSPAFDAVLSRPEIAYFKNFSYNAFSCNQKNEIAQSFTRLWTFKESFGKMLGLGLQASLSSANLLPLLKRGSGQCICDKLTFLFATRLLPTCALGICTKTGEMQDISINEVSNKALLTFLMTLFENSAHA